MLRNSSHLVLVVLALAVAGCSSSPHPVGEAPEAPFASAVIKPTAGNACRGSVAFTQQGGLVRVVIDLQGLRPGQLHAVHIHERGNCSAPDSSAGDHYNPGNDDHGLPPSDRRHAGDLGNVLADASGNAHVERAVRNFSVRGKDPVLGRAVIVRAGADDGSQPSGNAGPSIGCGTIEPR